MRGEHGDVIVIVARSREMRLWSTPRVSRRTRSCVESVARQLVELERRRPGGWRVAGYGADLPVGSPPALVVDTEGLLSAWRRYLGQPGTWYSWQLKRRLPEEVALASNGCLAIGGESYGTNVSKSLERWLDQLSAKRVAALWLDPLNLRVDPARHEVFSAAYLVAPDLFLKVADDKFQSAMLCLEPISSARRSLLLAQMSAIGSCFAGDVEQILLHPQYSFPSRYEALSVSTNGSVSCALDVAGHARCCGRASAVTADVPADRFVEVEVLSRRDAACGVTPQGLIECWGAILESPAGGSPIDRLCSHATCAITRGHGLEVLWSSTPHVPAALDHRVANAVVRPLGLGCAVLSPGTIGCWKSTSSAEEPSGGAFDWTGPPGQWTVVTVGADAVCATGNGDRTECWASHEPHKTLRSGPALSSIVITAGGAVCGLDRAGTVECRALSPEQQLPGPPPPHIAFTGLSEGDGLLCGVDKDRHVRCWGREWPDLRPPSARPARSGRDEAR